MINDVIFNNEKSAYNDWGIILTQSDIPLPEPKLFTVDIAGSDGVLDLSEALTGDVIYNNRNVKLTFELLELDEYYDLIGEISNYLHGKMVTFSLENDDNYYYTGRASINSWECSKNKGKIVISVNCEPYKLDIAETIASITVNNRTQEIILSNDRKRVCPILDVVGNITLNFEGQDYTLNAGKTQLLNLVLKEGNNQLSIGGNGTITITYRKGSL